MTEKMAELHRKAMELPCTPGVYIMYNSKNEIIYIGKSKALRNRVSQYFSNTTHNLKTQKMVNSVDRFEYMLTQTEIEALTLENRLIKLHMPKYNILLKDGKSYPYIKVTTGKEYPKVEITRKRALDGSKYFGPYTGTSTASSIIKTIYRVFGMPRCKRTFPKDIGKNRPCIYSQIGQCIAPCTGNVTKEEYSSLVNDVLSFLRGSFSDVKKSLEEKMIFASENLMFETAAVYRDRIKMLERLWDKQNVVGSPDAEYDVIALYEDLKASCIAVYYVREGALSDSDYFVFGSDRIIDFDSVCSFICELYNTREYIPKNILLGFEYDNDNIVALSQYLSELSGRKISISVPQKGERKALCNMAYKSAEVHAKQYCMDFERDNKILLKLADMLALEVVPESIEAYDISNFGSDNITGAMISVKDARFVKKNYRLYKIDELSSPDDYFSMRNVVERRLKHTELNYPDLILLDGGKTHVAVIRDLLSENGIDIPVFGMVKDEYHKTRALVSDAEEISIAKEQSVFQFIYKIQEEVHRFAINSMSKAKSKSLKHSSLEKINGIGQSKAKQLLLELGTLNNVKNASIDKLCLVKGISQKNAENIYNYFREKEKNKQ
ncbi:MAG: excinuclease ABC subunit UvrC [Clostridia bacterium]|nr:excinuclease ABC subunit UvrC [Clostridia bacterium]